MMFCIILYMSGTTKMEKGAVSLINGENEKHENVKFKNRTFWYKTCGDPNDRQDKGQNEYRQIKRLQRDPGKK